MIDRMMSVRRKKFCLWSLCFLGLLLMAGMYVHIEKPLGEEKINAKGMPSGLPMRMSLSSSKGNDNLLEHISEDLSSINTTRFSEVCDPTSLYEILHELFPVSNTTSRDGGKQQLRYRFDKSHYALNPDGKTLKLSSNVSCPRKRIFAGFPIPRTALMSYPGSGNTWVRHILEQLTGILTGAVYNDHTLRPKFPGEGKLDRVIAVKSHGISVPGTQKVRFDRQIVLLRNPYNAIFSLNEYLATGSKHTGQSHDLPNSSRWRNRMTQEISIWQNWCKDVMSKPGLPSLVVFYEDLMSSLFPELIKMAEFLQGPNLTRFSFCCALRENEGFFHRKPQKRRRAEDFYARADRSLLNKQIIDVANILASDRPDVSKRLLSYVKN